MKITLVMHNVRSAYNVGAILRTAEGLGVKHVIYSGYTPQYHDTTLLPHLSAKLDHQIAKSALGAEKIIAQQSVPDLLAWLRTQAQQGATIIGLENNLPESEQNLVFRLGSAALAERLQTAQRIVLILGEEVNGISADIKKECSLFIEIPMQGQKESLNVSVATGIAVWGLEQIATTESLPSATR